MKDKFLNFVKETANGGGWLLTDASEPVKNYIKKNFPDTYEEELKSYRTPRKFIKDGGKMIVVSISQEIWAGVEVFASKDLAFYVDDKEIFITKQKRSSEKILTAIDLEVDDEFRNLMISTGYITREEYNKYRNVESHRELTLVRIGVVDS